jgi:hypothetical protein
VADTIKITLVKEFPYRGAPEEWTNSYHFLGPDPGDWSTVATNLRNLEMPCFASEVVFKRAYCYAVHDDATRAGVTEIVEWGGITGTFSTSGLGLAGSSGDVAATVRWQTPDFTSGARPKRIYLRKYYHGVFSHSDPVGEQDALATEQLAKFELMAGALTEPDPIGAGDYCGPRGALAGNYLVSPWLTTRTLKRRGKRPPH